MREKRPLWLPMWLWAYRVCCRLLPRSFRERFGAETEDTLRHLLQDTRRTRGPRAAMTTAAAACGDVARVGVAERATAWHSALSSGVSSDVGQAVRIYRREPMLAGALALTLALVAGPALSIFSVLYHLVLAPLPYPDADRMVVVAQLTPGGLFYYLPVASVSDYRRVPAFSMVGGIFPVGSTVGPEGHAVRVQASRVTAGLLSGLGVPFLAGRDLERGEPGIVVTRGFALARFGSDAAAVGQTVVFNRQPTPIVGVIAYSPPLPGRPGIEVFSPHVNADLAVPPRKGGQAIVIAKLRPEASRAVALDQARAVAASVRREFGGPETSIDLSPLRVAVSGAMRVPLLILFGTVLVVFLIGVSSLASLVLARAASRAPDVAVRRSLGASRWRLIRSWLIEGTALAVPGIALGVWLGEGLLHYSRATLPPGFVPLPQSAGLAPMTAGGVALAVATALLFAIAPLAAGLLRPAATSLRDATRTIAGLRRVRLQSAMIVGQVALSLALVASAVWLSTSLWRMFSRPVGFDPASLVAINTQSTQLTPVQLQVARLMLSRLRQLDSDPASGVAVSSGVPGVNASPYAPRRIRPGEPEFTEEERPTLSRSGVSTDYFRVVGMPFLQGRAFTPADEANPQAVVIVSRSFANRWLPDGALGEVLTFVRDDRREVIGVVEDVHAGRLSQESIPQFYVPMTESIAPSTYLFRTSLSVETVRREATTMLRELDPGASLTVVSASDAMAMPLVLEIMANRLTIAMAGLALVLAVVNVYALSAFAVVQRTREIGIRIALGARSADTMRLIMHRGLLWVAVGLGFGTAAVYFLAAPLVERQLFETRTSDPWLLALAFAIVGGVAVVASWIPARRAASIDPAITLRAD